MALTKVAGAGSKNVILTSAQIAATGTNSSDVFPSGAFRQGTFQVVWASITGTATFELQTSNNNSNWDTVVGTSSTTSGAAGSTSINSAALPGAYCRVKITSAAGAGTLDVSACLKGHGE